MRIIVLTNYKLEDLLNWSVPFLLQFLNDMIEEKMSLGQLSRKKDGSSPGSRGKGGSSAFSSRKGKNTVVKRVSSTDLMKYQGQIKKVAGGK